MAFTVEVNATAISIPDKRARISVRLLDDAVPPNEVWVWTLDNADLTLGITQPAQLKNNLAAQIQADYVAHLAQQSQAAALLDALSAALTTELEARLNG